MKNLITLSIIITLAFFMTSCSDDSTLGVAEDTVDQTDSFELDTETGKMVEKMDVNMADILADPSTESIDITDILEKDALSASKGPEQKSILVNIYNRNGFVSRGGWFTVSYKTRYLRNCYYRYKVTIIPASGDPDVSIWGYDHSRYNKYRKVRGATRYPGYGKEETYFKKCDFGYYEEKAVIGVYADQNRSTSFRIIIDRIS